MTEKLWQKPILVGGMGLSVTLWLWSSLHHAAIDLGELGFLGAIATGGVFWLLQQKSPQNLFLSQQLPVNKQIVAEAIASASATIDYLETEAPNIDTTNLKEQLAQLPNSSQRQNLQLAITGGKSVGKTTLQQLLTTKEIRKNINFSETAAINAITDSESNVTKKSLAADLVLFLTTGDLTESEYKLLQQLRTAKQRVLLIFNKQDFYVPEEQALILQQLCYRVKEIISPEDVIGISAAPAPEKVRKHQEDGSVTEYMEPQPPDFGDLNARLHSIIKSESQELILGTTWREARELQKQAKQILNEIRRSRALPIIEQYQWIAAAAAFANPVAALDLVAAAAVSGQMLVDLGAIYQQKFSLDQAKTAAGTIGKLMVQLGIVELTTQTIGSLLKSHVVTYFAGGAVQGVSAAYLTRIAGLSLIEYLQEQEISAKSGEGFNLERLKGKIQKVFQENQRQAFLQGFATKAIGHLKPAKQEEKIA
ncbi:MAG: DUF697 domain-containing protein [Oscillatoria sp. PMC 1068.18]|nr:DUF697 domain-containing protein [Oscillatoria sp. PMC 1076.18]MEC4988872.1 DUF697 domain-containing protein [Oscillatoria sp. PMC 1068.18]